MLDGDDQLFGGDQNDIIIGDNGAISRDGSIIRTINQCLPYPLSPMWSKYTSSLDVATLVASAMSSCSMWAMVWVEMM
jgi:hypothetical protein